MTQTRRARRTRIALMLSLGLGVLPPILAACDSCGDCPSDAHWEYYCGGWITPGCGTYCLSGSGGGGRTMVNECCCEGEKPGMVRPLQPERPPADTLSAARFCALPARCD